MHNKFSKSRLSSNPHVARIPVPVRELHAGHRAAILEHFLQLHDDDRRLRSVFRREVVREIVAGRSLLAVV